PPRLVFLSTRTGLAGAPYVLLHRPPAMPGLGKQGIIVVPAAPLRLRQVRHVDDMEAAMTAARPHLVAEAQRMMQPVLPARPAWRLAARDVLSQHPPAADFSGALRVGDVVDDQDVADVAGHFSRDVGVALIHVEAMHADAAGALMHNLARL